MREEAVHNPSASHSLGTSLYTREALGRRVSSGPLRGAMREEAVHNPSASHSLGTSLYTREALGRRGWSRHREWARKNTIVNFPFP